LLGKLRRKLVADEVLSGSDGMQVGLLGPACPPILIARQLTAHPTHQEEQM
jgi:hypothetical protein